MAEKKKSRRLIEEGTILGAGVGAGATASKLYRDENLKNFELTDIKKTKPIDPKKVGDMLTPFDDDYAKFVKKLKPGDVLLTGDYRPTGNSKVYDVLAGGKDGYWHAALHTGKGRFIENVYQGSNRGSTKRSVNRGERIKVFRPNFSADPIENEKLVKEFTDRVVAKGKDLKYSKPDAVKALVKNKLGLKGKLGKCEGDFCSNFISKELPESAKKVMRVNPDIALPSDFANHPHFKEVAEMNLARTEKMYSKARLLKHGPKNIGIGLATGAALGLAHDVVPDKKSKNTILGAAAGGAAGAAAVNLSMRPYHANKDYLYSDIFDSAEKNYRKLKGIVNKDFRSPEKGGVPLPANYLEKRQKAKAKFLDYFTKGGKPKVYNKRLGKAALGAGAAGAALAFLATKDDK